MNYKKIIAVDAEGVIFELENEKYALALRGNSEDIAVASSYETFLRFCPYMQPVNDDSGCDQELLKECIKQLELPEHFIGIKR